MIRPISISLLVCVVLLAGCATPKGRQPDPRDPFERVNRATFAFNQAIDRTIAKPAARAYVRVVPRTARQGVSNFFANMEQPSMVVNDLLQGKLRAAGHDAGRFLINTTLGLGGLFDPATPAGLDRNEEDFGQTLGKWGVPSGPYLVAPIFGPSTVRDAVGNIADEYTEPTSYIEEDKVRWGLEALEQFDRRARLLQAEAALERAFDRYTLIRSAYLQRREFLVTDGAVAEEDDEFLDPEELEDQSEPPPPEEPPDD
jgi:phospholipid-binding lipoprotein MlaA